MSVTENINKQEFNDSNNQHRQVVGTIKDIAQQMANDVCLALAIEVEELNVKSYDFRRAIESTTLRVMQHIDNSSERIGIYEEALPGFTLMIIKKDDEKIKESDEVDVSDDGADSTTFEAASMVMQQFLKKSKSSIISIDHKALVIVLFPVIDTRKHLKSLGLYNLV